MQIFTPSGKFIFAMFRVFFCLLFIFLASAEAGNGFFSKEGVGLYIDAAYAPAWKNPSPGNGYVTINTEYEIAYLPPEMGYKFTIPNYRMNLEDGKFSPGILIRAELSANRKNSIQAIFQGLYEWKFDSFASANSIFTTSSSIGILIHDSLAEYIVDDIIFSNFGYRIRYKEGLNSAEFNFLDNLTPKYYDYFSFSLLYGPRFILFQNKMNIDGFIFSKDSIIFEGQTIQTSEDTMKADLTLENNNNFCGGQLGGIFRYRINSRIFFEVPIKGGVYLNILDYRIVLNYTDELDSQIYKGALKVDKEAYFVSYTAEASPKLEMHIGALYGYIGGSFLYLYGVSPAYDQVKVGKSLLTVENEGEFFLCGVTVGAGLHF